MKARVRDSARGQSDAAASFTFTTIDDLLRTINANRFLATQRVAWTFGWPPREWRALVGEHVLFRDAPTVHVVLHHRLARRGHS
jgi:hypothetical protein